MIDQTPAPVYTGRASGVFTGVLGAVMLVSLGAVAFGAVVSPEQNTLTSAIISGVLLAGIYGLILWAFGTVALRVEADRVVVAYGRSPFRSTFRLDQITDVDIEQVGFWTYGGLGYRGSRRLIKRAALVIRPGPAVRLHLADDTRFSISVDQTDEAVAAIQRARGQG